MIGTIFGNRNLRGIIAALGLYLVCSFGLRGAELAESRPRLVESTDADRRMTRGALRAPGVEEDWKAIGFCAGGEIPVWHDSEEDRLVFCDLGRRSEEKDYITKISIAPKKYEQLKCCLVSRLRNTTAFVFCDGENLEVVFRRYPDMVEEARVLIPLQRALYFTAAAIDTRGKRVAVASDDGVAVIEHDNDGWQRSVDWPLGLSKLACMSWSSNGELLAVGGIHGVYVARVDREVVKPLAIRAMPKVTATDPMTAQNPQDFLKRRSKGTLRQFGLNLHGVYSIKFSENDRVLTVCGAVRGRTKSRFIDGFVCSWDVTSTHLVRCDIIPRASAFTFTSWDDRRTDFVAVRDEARGYRILEIGVSDGKCKQIYLVNEELPFRRRVKQVAVLGDRSTLIALDGEGQVLEWPLSSAVAPSENDQYEEILP